MSAEKITVLFTSLLCVGALMSPGARGAGPARGAGDTARVRAPTPVAESPGGHPAAAQPAGSDSVSAAAHHQPPDSLTKAAVAKAAAARADSLRADSLRKIALKDSLLEVKRSVIGLYKRFPATVDSFYDPSAVRLNRLFSLDISGVSDAMRFSPVAVAVPFSLSSSLNRFLLYGLPAPCESGFLDENHRELTFGQLTGTDRLAASRVTIVEPDAWRGVRYGLHPLRLVSPEMAILWENGVFGESLLDVRFARPMARNVELAVFSSYRYFAGTSYSHDNGQVYTFYRTFGADTTLLVNRGYNPLTNEQVSGVRLVGYGPRGALGTLSYSYGDTKDDLAWGRVDGQAVPLQWARLTQYRNALRGGLSSLRLSGPVLLDFGLFLNTGVVKTVPLSPQTVEQAQGRRGEEQSYGAAVEPFAVLAGSDTARISCLLDRGDKTLYNGEQFRPDRARLGFTYRRPWTLRMLSGVLDASASYDQLTVDQKQAKEWEWHAGMDLELRRQRLALSVSRQALPYDRPLDTNLVAPGLLLDMYRSVGGQLFLSRAWAGLVLGYCRTAGIDSSPVMNAWPYGVPPYPSPTSVFLIAPVVGRFHGLALSSRWMISDAKPFVKAQVAFSYEAHLSSGNEHILVDLAFDYWSTRDRVELGSADDWKYWQREIADLYLGTSIRIGTFGLFYKVDNILDRKMAYVPGYLMPGLTFRWGFNWLIQG